MKIWILFLCAVVAAASAQSDESASDWDGDWKEYDDEWFKTRLAQLGIYNDEQNNSIEDGDSNVGVLERNQDEMDKKVEEDIKKFQEVEDEEEGDDVIDDYQFEDNRSEQSNQFNDAEPIHDIEDRNNQDMRHLESENDYDDYAVNLSDDDLSDNVLENEGMQIPEPQFSKDDTDPLPFPESSGEIKRIMDEAQAIINQEELKPNDFADNDEMSHENSDELNDIVEETNAIIEESLKPNDFAEDEPINKNENLSALLEESINDFASNDAEEDVNDIYSTSQEIPNKQEETGNVNQVEIPSSTEEENEDTVDKVYEDLNEDLDKLFETLDKLSKSDNDDEKPKPADVDYAVNSDESLDNKSDYESIFDSNLSDIFAQHSEINENDDSKDTNEENKEEQIEAKERENEDEEQDMEEDIESKEKVLEDAPYINDGLTSDDDKNIKKPIKSVYVDELTDDQLENLMKDFEKQHSEVFDVESQSDDHVVNEVTLEYGETKVITSDNYPAGYPTNRVVDWIVIGKGQGIELNLTDFAVNSALGDYLMVKPGQIDDSGADGIIFSYHLNQPRAFRFTDVDRMFIRFDSKDGFSFLRGFSLTLKVIAPPAAEPVPEPEPESLLPEPQHTLTVMLGGLTLAQFQEVSEQFRLLVADMATMYINANGVEPGLNTTAEITQIVSASFCNVQWPGFEECSQVRFSVPLVYEDDSEHRLNGADLKTMWETYVDTDPFAARLRQMGIEEFSVPNDSGVLTVWLIVALGVVLSAAMLAIALWRYSCFENYIRMPAHSDTDSLYEKRSSALYPTPHQMLPPLYAEKDYDSTRVDMGGYANRSYASTNMYDLDSDEDTVPRDRYTTDV